MISGLNSHAVSRNVILIRNRRYKNNCRKMHIADLILLWLQNSHYKNIPGLDVKVVAQTNMVKDY